ncbi:uncharacterized protein LOC110979733 [Acanthaster planci]|uniref:Uncharacterized protein LOC110979733 n=1 Tax=Acanthaster planci TaxID=133434 RepID=A0A8B7YFV7_ACAPL|nr:uncharacterized protein LOC110979733 [Acanthaster planci]
MGAWTSRSRTRDLSEISKLEEFIVKDTMVLFIDGNEKSIELCVGDMSKMGTRNKVDILMLSCLPGRYDTPKGTVVHSLQTNLGVNLADLAKDKEVDRRDTCKCWWSKNLGQIYLPFDRVLCYESGDHKPNTADLASTVFKCLKDISMEQECKIATSLLNTGRQNVGEVEMLEILVEAAILAMGDGLNLTQMMVFINGKYKAEGKCEPQTRNFKEICAKFDQLKSKHTVG